MSQQSLGRHADGDHRCRRVARCRRPGVRELRRGAGHDGRRRPGGRVLPRHAVPVLPRTRSRCTSRSCIGQRCASPPSWRPNGMPGRPTRSSTGSSGASRTVRADPLLAVWFEPENMAVPIAVSQSSELLRAMSAGLIGELDRAAVELDEIEQRARWMLRSHRVVAGHARSGRADRAPMIESFVVPLSSLPTRRGVSNDIQCEEVGLEFFDEAPDAVRERAWRSTATPDQVFDMFLDADAWVKWAWPITKVEWTSGLPDRDRFDAHGAHARRPRRLRGVHRLRTRRTDGVPVQ